MSIPSVTLRDPKTPSSAEILVGFGFNCYQFVTQLDGQTVDVLWSAEGFADGTHRPSGSGIPLLFPFPGRIQGTQLHWQGQTYSLQEGDGRGNAIHGFVHDQPWRVLSQTESTVTGQFQASVDNPALLSSWPSDFCITVTYHLHGHRLSSHFEVFNPGDSPLPWGLGTHPYFRIPLTPAGTSAACRLVLPVRARWVLQDMNATGERMAVENAQELQSGFSLDTRQFDNVFTELVPDDHQRFVARVEDPASRMAVQVEFAAPFRECVVYTPDHREAVCIEPYTCVPDAFRLQPCGVDAGLQVIAPGERRTAEVHMQVMPL